MIDTEVKKDLAEMGIAEESIRDNHAFRKIIKELKCFKEVHIKEEEEVGVTVRMKERKK